MVHNGELAVQARVGAAFPGSIGNAMPPVAAYFAATREFCLVSGLGRDQSVWTTMLSGPAGFVHADGDHAVRVHARPRSTDPLAALLTGGGPVGLLLYDDHRRMRVNGIARPTADGFVIDADQVFSNCGRYITNRRGVAIDPLPVDVATGGELTWGQRDLITAADTFFIGSRHPDGGADASHRGGNPGFVHVDGAGELNWPDYNGNRMFMTLGNITLDPRIGLLFLDWTQGTLLYVAGHAEIDWSDNAARALPGAERVVRLHIDAVQQTTHGIPMTWSTVALSRYNPAEPVPA